MVLELTCMSQWGDQVRGNGNREAPYHEIHHRWERTQSKVEEQPRSAGSGAGSRHAIEILTSGI
jgi:hypothetical protein